METLLPARLKPLTLLILAGLWLAAGLGFHFFYPGSLTPADIEKQVNKNIVRIEAELRLQVQRLEQRSEALLARFRAGNLNESELEPQEALIEEKEGVVASTIGEIYYFRLDPLPQGEWRLLQKGQDIFFLRLVQPHSYYVRFFMNAGSNFILSGLRFPFAIRELKLTGQPLAVAPDEFYFQQDRQQFVRTGCCAIPKGNWFSTWCFRQPTLLSAIVKSRACWSWPGWDFWLRRCFSLAAAAQRFALSCSAFWRCCCSLSDCTR